MRRRGCVAVAAAMGMLVLGGCDAIAPPTLSQEQIADDRAWAESVLDDDATLDGLLGMGSIGSDRNAPESDGDGGISWDFPQLTEVTGATVTCSGDSGLTVAIELTGRTTATTHAADVPCDREVHRIPISPAEPVLRVTARGSGTGTTSGVVEIEGTPPTHDTWIDALAVPEGSYAYQTVGTFGPTDQVNPFEETALDIPVGAHTVEVDCDGPTFLTITASVTGSLDDAASGEPVELTCPGSTTIEVTTTEPGLVFRADSADTAGAVRFRVDEGVTYPAP